ncbi:hypothetical protein CROQUDRAFT_658773 [Cronartium quercuum f. sp. fusiforme G11]|uniref:Uncharacterized protein n=1 Tax=Cronartium quercuum f. sp. fusiforme G11 TaxID=708437 RepID=A0A9P6TC65_9BASI|nr:hypothetical protein CROQUDRAFT_658773 [Cronartium quercuum f. sp. fusiforme G11]
MPSFSLDFLIVCLSIIALEATAILARNERTSVSSELVFRGVPRAFPYVHRIQRRKRCFCVGGRLNGMGSMIAEMPFLDNTNTGGNFFGFPLFFAGFDRSAVSSAFSGGYSSYRQTSRFMNRPDGPPIGLPNFNMITSDINRVKINNQTGTRNPRVSSQVVGPGFILAPQRSTRVSSFERNRNGTAIDRTTLPPVRGGTSGRGERTGKLVQIGRNQTGQIEQPCTLDKSRKPGTPCPPELNNSLSGINRVSENSRGSGQKLSPYSQGLGFSGVRSPQRAGKASSLEKGSNNKTIYSGTPSFTSTTIPQKTVQPTQNQTSEQLLNIGNNKTGQIGSPCNLGAPGKHDSPCDNQELQSENSKNTLTKFGNSLLSTINATNAGSDTPEASNLFYHQIHKNSSRSVIQIDSRKNKSISNDALKITGIINSSVTDQIKVSGTVSNSTRFQKNDDSLDPCSDCTP